MMTIEDCQLPGYEGMAGDACPYGGEHDRLWVREAFAKTVVHQAMGAVWTVYRECDNRTDYGGPWKPSIHMPRASCRTILEITSVRVERLHDISTDDIIAEGLSTTLRGYDAEVDLRDQWRALWESTGGNWDANPWLWCISFRRLP